MQGVPDDEVADWKKVLADEVARDWVNGSCRVKRTSSGTSSGNCKGSGVVVVLTMATRLEVELMRLEGE